MLLERAGQAARDAPERIATSRAPPSPTPASTPQGACFTYALSERVILFEIKESRSGAKEIADILVKCCEHIVRAVALLPSMAKSREILDITVAIGKLENEADSIYRQSIAALFKPGNDPLEVMKWRDIFDALESATDRCADVANVIEGVVLEYA